MKDRSGGAVKQKWFENSPTGLDEFFDGVDEAELAIEASLELFRNEAL